MRPMSATLDRSTVRPCQIRRAPPPRTPSGAFGPPLSRVRLLCPLYCGHPIGLRHVILAQSPLAMPGVLGLVSAGLSLACARARAPCGRLPGRPLPAVRGQRPRAVHTRGWWELPCLHACARWLSRSLLHSHPHTTNSTSCPAFVRQVRACHTSIVLTDCSECLAPFSSSRLSPSTTQP